MLNASMAWNANAIPDRQHSFRGHSIRERANHCLWPEATCRKSSTNTFGASTKEVCVPEREPLQLSLPVSRGIHE